MTNDIDREVAQFRRQLDGLSAIDPDQIATDLQGLTTEILSAKDHLWAAVALREFLYARPGDPDYARAVAVAALTQVGLHVFLTAEMGSLDGEDGLLRRVKRLAYAARALGLDQWTGAV